MMIGAKRKGEIIPRSQFRYKLVFVMQANACQVYAFTTKADARKFGKAHATPHNTVRYDLTGWPTLNDAERGSVRVVAGYFGFKAEPMAHNYNAGVHVDTFMRPTGVCKVWKF